MNQWFTPSGEGNIIWCFKPVDNFLKRSRGMSFSGRLKDSRGHMPHV